jgi:virulence factor Mce-like protein
VRQRKNIAAEVFDNPILVGTITLLIVVVAVYLSYIAENGLPFIPSYSVSVDVQNAAELVKNADVRIGGARVGQVLTITPEPADPTNTAWPKPFARLKLQLQKSIEPLPPDTHYQVRLASVLGGKYVELIPGADTSKADGIPDGSTVSLKKGLNVPFVDLDTAFDTFGPKTQKGLRNAVGQLGAAVAGRGTQFNNTIYELHKLIGPIDNLLRLFASPNTHLSQFISGAAATTGALAPVAPTISSLLSEGATTFQALNAADPALGNTIDALPGTESQATTVFQNSEPVLADAASIAVALRPGAALLPRAGAKLDSLITHATPVFALAPNLATKLTDALSAVGTLAKDPASSQTFKTLGSSDLATFGSSAFVGLGAILKTVASAQFACNVTGTWLRNFASTISEGDASGTWVRFASIIDVPQTFLAAKPSADLHENVYPVEDSSACQAGNYGYSPGQAINNPGATGKSVDATAPPTGVLDLGRKAGLVP